MIKSQDEVMEGIERVDVSYASSYKGGLEHEMEITTICDGDAVRWVIRVRRRVHVMLKPEWISVCAGEV